MIQPDAVPKTSPTHSPAKKVMTTKARITPTVEKNTPGSVLSLSARSIRSDMISPVVSAPSEHRCRIE